MKRLVGAGLISLAIALISAQCGGAIPNRTQSSNQAADVPAQETVAEEPVAPAAEEVVEAAEAVESEPEVAEEEAEPEAVEVEEEEAMETPETEAEEEAMAASDGHGDANCEDPFGGQTVRFRQEAWTVDILSRFVKPEVIGEAQVDTTNFCLHSVDYSEIISGGPPPDGIPPIDNPTFDSIAVGDEWLADVQPVIALEVNGDARAYPLGILTRHEIANDVVGGTPVAVTFCPLCNAGIVFNREVDGDVLRFGVSGNLRNSDMVMWDNKSLSWWQQFTGQAIVGDMTGTQLEILPAQMVAWKDFKEAFPEGQVLSNNGRDYGFNPYAGYDSTTEPFLFLGTPDPRLRATERVLGFFEQDISVAYPLSVIRREVVIEDTLGDNNVVIFYEPGQVSALDKGVIESSKEVGSAAMFIPEVEGRALTFTHNKGVITDNETGSEWNVFGQAVSGELEGAQLEPVLSFMHFWFAWAAFQPDTTIYEG